MTLVHTTYLLIFCILSLRGFVCVKPEYIWNKPKSYRSPTETWLIGKCDPGASNDENRKKCENPEPDSSLQSLVPVTDIDRNEHYRNIFCAACNYHHKTSDLRSWKIRLQCDDEVELPEQDTKVLESKYCSIAFENLEGVYPSFCASMSSYTISKCNETRL